MFGRREAPVIICHGFHLSGGEHVKVRVLRSDGSDYWVSGTISVVAGRKGWDVEDSTVDSIVLLEG